MTEKKNSTDIVLLISILVLIVIGIVMVYSASFAVAVVKYGDAHFFLKRHLVRVGLGLIAMLILSKIDYHVYSRIAKVGLYCAFGLLIYMLFVQSVTVKGVNRWIEIGQFSFQPSEVTKYALILYLADTLARKQEKLWSFVDGYLPLLMIVSGTALLIFLEPDFSSAVFLTAIAIMILYLGHVRVKHLAFTGLTALPFIYLAVFNSSYRFQRLMGFFNPKSDLLGSNYQINQSLISLGSGGIFGQGIGNSKEKLLYLPEPFTDFIFSILGEEFGFVGATFVLTLFLVIFWRGVVIARQAPDLFASLLAIGITITIVLAAFINVGVISGLLPTTGLPIPFISYGGTSLLCSLGACGLLLNIARHTKQKTGKQISNQRSIYHNM
jgi:cell division protein FtsW